MADDTKQILDPRERFSDPEETDRISAESTQANIFTAMPVVIKKHDHEKNAVHTQIATKLLHLNEGKPEWKEIAKNEDIPVYYPGGGGAMITFPVQDGDEGLMVFASRSIDKWWQQGGVQEQMHSRMHDVSDGFCFPGFYSQPNKIPKVSEKTLQIRTRDGKSFFEFNPATKAKGKDGKEINTLADEKPSLSMTIEAGIKIDSFGISGRIDINAKGDVVLFSPTVRLGGPNARKWIAPNVYVIAGGGGGGGGGSGPNGETGVVVGPIHLTQDVIGTGDNDIPTTVVALQHRMLSIEPPLNGQALVWDDVLQVWKPGEGSIIAGAGLTKTGNQIDVIGTSARILVNADNIDIDPTYAGQASITTLGSISSGTWNGTTIAVNHGGSGAVTLSGYLFGNGTSAFTASPTIPNTAISGLGTMSTQNANAVAITGGTIDGVTFDCGTF